MSSLLVRPRFYNESFITQNLRLSKELEEATIQHTLRVVKTIFGWLETRRLVNDEYQPEDAEVEVEHQCKLHGVAEAHRQAAQRMVMDLYLRRNVG